MTEYEKQRELIKELLRHDKIKSMVISKNIIRIVKIALKDDSELIYKGELATKIAIYILGA